MHGEPDGTVTLTPPVPLVSEQPSDEPIVAKTMVFPENEDGTPS